MYQNSFWPGAYSFKDEVKLFVLWFKEQMETILFKIYEAERTLNT